MRRDCSFCAKSVRYNIFTNGALYGSTTAMQLIFKKWKYQWHRPFVLRNFLQLLQSFALVCFSLRIQPINAFLKDGSDACGLRARLRVYDGDLPPSVQCFWGFAT